MVTSAYLVNPRGERSNAAILAKFFGDDPGSAGEVVLPAKLMVHLPVRLREAGRHRRWLDDDTVSLVRALGRRDLWLLVGRCVQQAGQVFLGALKLFFQRLDPSGG